MGNSAKNSNQSHFRFPSSKQSKKWIKISKKSSTKRQREQPTNLGSNVESCSVMSWNCHHKLEIIEQSLIQMQSNIDITTSNSTSSNSGLELELESITNDVSNTIYGITHCCLDGLPNERTLIDYWVQKALTNRKNTVILFEIADMDKIYDILGWKSGDNVIIQTGKKIQEYCDWYTRDYNFTFKVFHPDFSLNEFIVITQCDDDQIINDFCNCALTDVAKSVKCFFQETTLWVGYITTDNHKKPDNDEEIRYEFRRWYQKTKSAIKECMKVCRYPSTTASDRIMKWLPKKIRSLQGSKIIEILNLYSYSNLHNKQTKIHDIINAIDKLLKNGADLNYSDVYGYTALFYSIHINNEELIRFLLNYEIDCDYQNKCGETPLIYALKQELRESICILLAKRIKYPSIPDNQNITPLVYALNNGYFRVMNILFQKGALNYRNSIIACCREDNDIILRDIIIESGLIWSVKLDDIGRSILHYAILHKSRKIIKMCLHYNYIDVNITDNNSWNPLHYAIAKHYNEIAAVLLQYDCDIHLKTKENCNSYQIAQNYKNTEGLQLLFDFDYKNDNKCNIISGNIKVIDTSDNDNDSDYYQNGNNDAWNKENKDTNNRQQTKTITKQQSQSESQKTNNSENVKKQASKISVIDEHRFYAKNKLIDDDYDDDEYYDSVTSDQSNQTRIIHPSSSNSQLLMEYDNTYNNNIIVCEDSDSDQDISSISNDDNNKYLDASYIDKIEMGIISSSNSLSIYK